MFLDEVQNRVQPQPKTKWFAQDVLLEAREKNSPCKINIALHFMLSNFNYSTLPSRIWTKTPDSHYKKHVDLEKQLQYSLEGGHAEWTKNEGVLSACWWYNTKEDGNDADNLPRSLSPSMLSCSLLSPLPAKLENCQLRTSESWLQLARNGLLKNPRF